MGFNQSTLKYSIHSDTGSSGDNLENGGIPNTISLKTCRRLCNENSSCKGFVYDSNGCQLKKEVHPMKTDNSLLHIKSTESSKPFLVWGIIIVVLVLIIFLLLKK